MSHVYLWVKYLYGRSFNGVVSPKFSKDDSPYYSVQNIGVIRMSWSAMTCHFSVIHVPLRANLEAPWHRTNGLRGGSAFLFLPVFTGSIASVEEGRFVQRIINCTLHKDCRVSLLLVTHRRRVGLCFCPVPFSLVDALRPIGKPLIQQY